MNISSNISSISSHQTMMNTSAHNVAKGSSNGQAELAKEFTNQIVAQGAVEVNVSAIKTQDEILGSLLDIKA